MRNSITTLFCVFSLIAYSQKSPSLEIVPISEPIKGNTYALVMGVSKYENPNIPALKYADVDALIFREYLISSGVEKENIITLVNETATNSAFWTTLNYLTDKVKEGDLVYIFFSGHGDVESKTIFKDAYLLPYDSPYTVYPMGAIGINYLKSWISTFSAKGVQTIFIADACKSGNLIGGREGMDATASILKDKWQDEIKIVSCQPGELSLEGDQWGGGRGLFSFELINGLSGNADKNKDELISLRELNLYLLEKVPEQSGRNPQNPIITGNYEATISTTNETFIALNQNVQSFYLSKQNIDTIAFASKGIIQIPKKTDSTDETKNYKENQSLVLFKELEKLVQEGKIISLYPPHAFSVYEEMVKLNDSLALESAKLLLSERTLKNVQRFVRFIIGDISEKEHGEINIVKISLEATMLRSLIGDKKLIESGNVARVLFAESCRSLRKFVNDESLLMPKELALMKLDSALTFDPGAVYVNCLKGMVLEFEFQDKNSALIEYQMALANNPNFRIARNMLLRQLIAVKDYTQILECTADHRIHPLNALYRYMAFKNLNMLDSIETYEAVIQSQTHFPLNPKKEFETCTETADFFLEQRSLENAITFYQKAAKSLERCSTIDDNHFDLFLENIAKIYYNISCAYSLLKNEKEALHYIEKSISSGWNDFEWLMNDSDLEFIRKSKKFWNIIEANGTSLYNIACMYAKIGEEKKALKYLKKAFSVGWSDFEWAKIDSDLISIQSTKEFQSLIQKYNR